MLFINTARLAKHVREKKALGLSVFLPNTWFDNNQKCSASTLQFANLNVSQSYVAAKKPQTLPFFLTPKAKTKHVGWGYTPL